ncbi:MAG: formylglycine-generating enzyme family protein [Chloroflexi bacterium]|nr:formylglycine-generating enzyme family protein [Chloroflexota bacterium]
MTNKDNCSCCTPERSSGSGGLPATAPPALAASSGRVSGVAAIKAELRSDLVHLEGGAFAMGTDNRRFPGDGEGPIREVTVSPFAIAAREVTNRQFASFAADSGYTTEAERFGWSFVFHNFVSEETGKSITSAVHSARWWWQVNGADWGHPHGPDSSWRDIPDNPAVHVSWNDASAFAAWAGTRLPTEAEWEFAARGGLDGATFAWGDELTPDGKHMCNIWQGDFPDSNTKEDGFHGTSPVGSFPPNGYGLFDSAGNIWEWCSDWWSATYHQNERRLTRVDPAGPRQGQAKVTKGGSYLCHDSYCNRYRVGARTSSTPDSSTGNMGFRLAIDL